ncbi:hypothetical protein [Clostridium intestinale]|nr:hypothetical protein [Clostridium intestinale]
MYLKILIYETILIDIYLSNQEFKENKNKIDFDVKKIDHCFKNAFK